MKKILWMIAVYTLVGCRNQSINKDPKIEVISSGPKYQIEKKDLQKEKLIINKIDSFSSIDQNNQEINLKRVLNKGPIVFIGLLYRCPCNEKAQPIINNLALKYKDKATFIGLMPGEKKYLSKYLQRTRCAHLVVLDKDLALISELQMSSSGFMALVTQNNQVMKRWPGYSTNILKELNKDLAQITHTSFTSFDPQYAPSEITCGCPYAKNQ